MRRRKLLLIFLAVYTVIKILKKLFWWILVSFIILCPTLIFNSLIWSSVKKLMHNIENDFFLLQNIIPFIEKFNTFWLLGECLGLIVCLLISVAYFTLLERKYIASIQRRRGPNVIGYYGLLQPLADGLKLFVKESICPSNADSALFFFAPLVAFSLSLIGWAVIPFGPSHVIADIDLGSLYLFAVSSLSVYGILTSGWASNSKYAFLGCLRSAAQIVSYEISIGFILASLILSVGSINLTDIVIAQEDKFFLWPHLPLFGIFLVSILAETNRHPFDLPEAEAELVSGYNVEYSAIGFALFFLAEYANMLIISSFGVLLFIGGWLPFLNCLSFIPSVINYGIKLILFVLFFILSRAFLPRFRYDQLISLGWRAFLPFTLAWLVLTGGILLSFNALPLN